MHISQRKTYSALSVEWTVACLPVERTRPALLYLTAGCLSWPDGGHWPTTCFCALDRLSLSSKWLGEWRQAGFWPHVSSDLVFLSRAQLYPVTWPGHALAREDTQPPSLLAFIVAPECHSLLHQAISTSWQVPMVWQRNRGLKMDCNICNPGNKLSPLYPRWPDTLFLKKF